MSDHEFIYEPSNEDEQKIAIALDSFKEELAAQGVDYIGFILTTVYQPQVGEENVVTISDGLAPTEVEYLLEQVTGAHTEAFKKHRGHSTESKDDPEPPPQAGWQNFN